MSERSRELEQEWRDNLESQWEEWQQEQLDNAEKHWEGGIQEAYDMARADTLEGLSREVTSDEWDSAIKEVWDYLSTGDGEVRYRMSAEQTEAVKAIFDRHGVALSGDTVLPAFNQDLLTEQHAHLQDWSEWADAQEPPDFSDDIIDFDEWVSNYADDFSSDGTKVSFKFRSTSDDTFFERTFDRDAGDLHVHHDYFRVDKSSTTPGFSKQLFRGLMETYERIGVDRITTNANIDVGSYAWGRYGFAPEDDYVYRSIQSRAQSVFSAMKPGHEVSYNDEVLVRGADGKATRTTKKVTVALSAAQIKGVLKLAQGLRNNDQQAFWHLIDARVSGRIAGTDQKAAFSIGKFLMMDFHWNAEFLLGDAQQMARWKGYLGKPGVTHDADVAVQDRAPQVGAGGHVVPAVRVHAVQEDQAGADG